MSIIALTNSMANISSRHDPDAELIQQIAEGDEQAFEKLVKKYQHAAFNTIYRYIGNYDDVEDVAQEVFIKIWHHAGSFKGKSKFSTWFYRIVVNQCLNYRSKHKHKPVSLDGIVETGRIPKSLKTETDYEQRQRTAIVRKAVNELPERQRIALVLAKFEEKSYKEIAQIMKVSVSSVEALIFRARSTLKMKLIALRKNGKI